MAEKKLGAKAGVVAGAIYGVLAGIVGIIYLIAKKDEIIAMLNGQLSSLGVNVPMTAEQLYPMTIIGAPINAIISGLIIGAVLGVVFSLLREELIGKNNRIRGVCFSVLILIALGIGELAAPNLSMGFILINTGFLPSAVLGVIFFLAFGYLLGMFYDRFKPK